ncbi:TraG family conjugative transposon ATPase [Pontibacter qinzhouensis]|uniref:TraG family conjugative transposon ATPase n=1 Tax=Pontibacter qinzhouensis TaxID=2603253 RepID=A0A5C8J307_9BACT|nr:TraG family conjugative transposon ATPase [Pontibacter qinzhouensis]TXK31131.1 TraG family conjugative transposon ATPase [Pontibacter qinzhouensis]
MAQPIDLEHLLPVYKVEHGCILSRQGDITLAYEAILPEIFSLSDAEYEAFHQALLKAIRLLPRFTVFHKQDWFLEASYQADFSKDGQSFLSRASERFFHGRPFLEHHCYILLTKRPEDRRPSSSLVSNLLRRSLAPRQTLHPLLFQDFVGQAGQFERVLQDSGFVRLRRLTDTELAGTKEKAGLLERYCGLLPEEAKPLLQDIHLQQGIRIGDKRCQLFVLADAEHLPALCGPRITYDRYSTDRSKFSTGFASPLGQLLPCNHLYNQYIFLEDASQTIKRLESKRLRLQSLAAYSRENALARDATHAFLNEALGQQRLPVKAHFNVLAWTEQPERHKELRNLVSSAMAQLDATPKLETDGAPQLFWAGLPGNAADFPMNDTFDTFLEQACCFLSLEAGYRSSTSPVGLRLGDRLTGKPVHVDISDEPVSKGICTNRNKFILGPSGSGKSFFTNHLVRSLHEQGSHIVLVDVGHSYKGLCELAGGYYFTYREDKPIRFNPFYLSEGDTLDTEKKESIKTLLLALWKKDSETFSRSEYVALSNALELYYQHLQEHQQVFPCFDSFYDFVQTVFKEKLKADRVKEKDFDLDNFLYVLRPYYQSGEFGYLLNARENLDLLQERFIVFELDNIKDHPILFPVVTIIIMEVFISKMRKLKGVRKVILIEEAWKAIAREGMAEYIRYLFKTVRKFYGEAIVVTQEVEDIISSPVVKQAIINNSDCKILLDQGKYLHKFDGIQQLLGLTEKEKALVLSINKANDPARRYNEVFISLGGTRSRVFRTEVSLEEYLTYTTEESEKVKVQAYAQKYGGDMRKGIEELANDIRAGLTGG